MTAPRPAMPSPLPPPPALPPETVREKLANAVVILRANTKVSLDNAFQPIGAYDRAVVLLQSAIDQLDGKVSCAR